MKQLINEINRVRELMFVPLLLEGGGIGGVLDNFWDNLLLYDVQKLTKEEQQVLDGIIKNSNTLKKVGINSISDTLTKEGKDLLIKTIRNNSDEITTALKKFSNEYLSQISIRLETNLQAVSNKLSLDVKNDLTKLKTNGFDNFRPYELELLKNKLVNLKSQYKNDLSIIELSDDVIDGIETKIKTNEINSTNISKKIGSQADTIKWGNLGKGYAILNLITNYGGRYVVMVKDPGGVLRPFYQRTGGGGAAQGWASAGNWVPFYGVADVTLLTDDGIKRIKDWMIKPANGRMGEEGDDVISNLLGETLGTNGIKDVDYPIGNFNKSMTETPSGTEMNNWLKNQGYAITPNNGFLPYLKPPSELHGIP
jgi:hypothetical protein